MKYVIPMLLVALCFLSCKNKTHMLENVSAQKIDISTLENQIDPICNMPVKDHLSDTALINNKVWGFCSSACKEKYLNSK